MASADATAVSGAPESTFTKVLLTVQSLEDQLAGAKESAKRAVSERDAAQNKVHRLENELTACRSETQKAVSELQDGIQHWTAQAKAAESEKTANSKRASALSLQLESLRSSRDKNYQTLKEKQHKMDLEMELMKDECNRMQKQLKSYTGLLNALETELMKTRQASTDVKAIVSENCRLGKIKRQAAAFKTLRARVQEKEKALQDLVSAHDTAARQLASSKTEAANLRRNVDLLEAGEKEHIAAKNELHRSLQRSNALLAEARSASEQHRVTLDKLRQNLQALDAEALQRAAIDAATVRQQGVQLSALRSEVDRLHAQLAEKYAPGNNVPRFQEPPFSLVEHADQGTDTRATIQSAAQTALQEAGNACKTHPVVQASNPKLGPQQTGQAAKITVEGHGEEAGHSSAAQLESGTPETAATPAPAAPAARSNAADQDALCASGPSRSLLHSAVPAPQQHTGRSEPQEHRSAPRRDTAVFAADTPDELEIDNDEEMPQRPPQPQFAQQGQFGRLSGMGARRSSTGISTDRRGAWAPTGALDLAKKAESPSLAAAQGPSTGVSAAEDSKRNASASAGECSAEYTAAPAGDRSAASEHRAKKPRTSGADMERNPPSTEGSSGVPSGSRSPRDLFASFTSLQDLSDDEDAPSAV